MAVLSIVVGNQLKPKVILIPSYGIALQFFALVLGSGIPLVSFAYVVF